jgi:competence protein ComEC
MFRRPVIAALIFYLILLIILDFLGFFKPEIRSFLYYFSRYRQPVSIEGKVISDIEKTKSEQKFFMQVYKAGGFKADEKILASAPLGYSLSYGDIIALEGQVILPQKAAFPLIFDYQSYLARQNIYVLFKADSFEFIKSRPNAVKKAALLIRKDMSEKIEKNFKSPKSGVLKALLIGDKTSVPLDIKDSFTNAGVMHLLVISGLHIGFVSLFFLTVFKLAFLPLKTIFFLTIPFVFFYVLITGANPPAVRAGIMFSCILISLSLNREPLIYNSLALSALIILIFDKQALFTASFQMSYIAVCGIIFLGSRISSCFKNIKNFRIKFLTSLFSTAVSAQILMLPVLIFYFGKVSLTTIPANMLLVPTAAIITIMSFLFYFSTFLSQFLSEILIYPLSAFLSGFLYIVEFLGNSKYSAVQIPPLSFLQIFFFYLFVFCAVYFKGKKKFTALFAALFLFFSLWGILKIRDRKSVKL